MSDVPNLVPPAVDASDEARHEPGAGRLWNESWYCDVADLTQGIGAYLRFGLYPNRSQTWFQLTVAGPDRPLVSLRDETAPLATGDGQHLDTETWSCSLYAEEPLRRWRVAASGSAETFDDPSAIYRGEPGRPTEVAIDLTWHSVGVPYHYGVTTRYEVSTRVTGTIAVDGEATVIDAPGQRDHSWGVRDWWEFEWCWSAGALDDGTRFHLSDIRLPSGSAGFGYTLDPGGDLVPASSISATEVRGDHGFVTTASLGIEPGGLVLDVEPLAVSPLRFVADDGRFSYFPRALCRYSAPDGRVGSGWTEWNQLEHRV